MGTEALSSVGVVGIVTNDVDLDEDATSDKAVAGAKVTVQQGAGVGIVRGDDTRG